MLHVLSTSGGSSHLDIKEARRQNRKGDIKGEEDRIN
jgi:hypothetical protein